MYPSVRSIRLQSPSALPSAFLMAAILWGGMLPPLLQAGSLPPGSVEFTASGSSVAATVLFTPVNGGIDITLTNTETGTLAKGQAISSLSFSVSGGLSTPTAFTELKGSKFNPTSGGSWTSSSGTPFDKTPSHSKPNAIDHWGFSPSGSSVTLATAGSSVSGATKNPHYMILPSSGTAGHGKSLANSKFYPFIIGPADFFLTVPGVTSNSNLFDSNFNSLISGVQVGFGTGPDTTSGAVYSDHGSQNGGAFPAQSTTPAPSSVVLLGFGGLGLAVILARSQRRRVAA